eukprot:126506-Hanusia_phi.AAC.2
MMNDINLHRDGGSRDSDASGVSRAYSWSGPSILQVLACDVRASLLRDAAVTPHPMVSSSSPHVLTASRCKMSGYLPCR